ncbi:hypothetical protein HY384_03595 [Candidatus Daviesbacteria bacterium]|nr:hypothetical protein [Candidatus Daviesbacteria bacterium]
MANQIERIERQIRETEIREVDATKRSLMDFGIAATALVLWPISLSALMQDYPPNSTLTTVMLADLGLFTAGIAATLYRVKQAVNCSRLQSKLWAERIHTVVDMARQSQLPPTLSQ